MDECRKTLIEAYVV